MYDSRQLAYLQAMDIVPWVRRERIAVQTRQVLPEVGVYTRGSGPWLVVSAAPPSEKRIAADVMRWLDKVPLTWVYLEPAGSAEPLAPLFAAGQIERVLYFGMAQKAQLRGLGVSDEYLAPEWAEFVRDGRLKKDLWLQLGPVLTATP